MYKSKKAFTLVELLLALSLAAVVMAALYSIFFAGSKLFQRASPQNQVSFKAYRILEDLSRELEGAVSYDTSQSYPQMKIFSCEDNTIQFLNPTDEGLKVVRYFLENVSQAGWSGTKIGQTYKKNVKTEVNSIKADFTKENLVREEESLVEFLNADGKPEGKRKILNKSVRQGSLKFTCRYPETRQDSEAQVVIFPESVTVAFEILTDDKKAGQQKFTRDIFIFNRGL